LENSKKYCIFAPHFCQKNYHAGLFFDGAKIIKMLDTIIICIGILLVCFVFLAITMLIKKNGRFPNTHVSGNKALRDRGIHCAQTQDWEDRHHKGLYD